MNETESHEVSKSDPKPKPYRPKRTSESGRAVQPRPEVSKSGRENFSRKHRSMMDRIEINPGDIKRYRGF